jgi:hypothetical protein
MDFSIGIVAIAEDKSPFCLRSLPDRPFTARMGFDRWLNLSQNIAEVFVPVEYQDCRFCIAPVQITIENLI